MARNQTQDKKKFLEALPEALFIGSAAETINLPRATLYRWLSEDSKFADAVNEAKRPGIDRVNEFAREHLISAIGKDNMRAIMFWLKHMDPDFASGKSALLPTHTRTVPIQVLSTKDRIQRMKKKSEDSKSI